MIPKANHHNKEYFKDPEVFRPERWEEDFSSVPSFGIIGGFSSGGRSCIGKHLALLTAKVGLIKFMKRYDEIHVDQKELKYHVHLVYSPDPIVCRLKRSCETIDSYSLNTSTEEETKLRVLSEGDMVKQK